MSYGLARPLDDRISSTCPEVYRIRDDTLTATTCNNLACQYNGNVFNYQEGECQVKVCDTADLQLSEDWGAFEVHVMIGKS